MINKKKKAVAFEAEEDKNKMREAREAREWLALEEIKAVINVLGR